MNDNVFGLIVALISICFALGGLIAGETMERKRIYNVCLEKNASVPYGQAKIICTDFTK